MLGGIVAVVLLLVSRGFTSGAVFSIILGFTGGVAGTMLSFILPAMFYLAKMPPAAPLHWVMRVMLVGGLVVLVVILGPYEVVTNAINHQR